MIPANSERILLLATDRKELLQIEPVLKWDGIQVPRRTSRIIDAFPNRPSNIIMLNPTNVAVSLAVWIATALLLLSEILNDKYEKRSVYISSVMCHYTRAYILFRIYSNSTGFNRWQNRNK